jgi:UPF0716 protein FxsA
VSQVGGTSPQPARSAFGRRIRWVPLGVLLLGAAEFLTLLGVAQLIGTPLAIIILIALSLLGGLLVRREGIRAWRRLRTARRAGGPAGDEVLYGVVGLLAALLLLVPGYLTGVAGLLLLLPPVRKLVRNRMRQATEKRVSPQAATEMFGPHKVRASTAKPPPATEAASSEVIEGEIVD